MPYQVSRYQTSNLIHPICTPVPHPRHLQPPSPVAETASQPPEMAYDYVDSDSSYDEGPPLVRSTNPKNGMNLRKTERLKRPARYRDDLEPLDPGRPIFVHQDPIFNMDRAKFVRWHSLELNEASPGEAQYKMWQEQGEPRDAFGEPIAPTFAAGQVAESPRPTVAHLRRRSTTVRPDLSQPVIDSIERRDAFDEAFEANLTAFEDDEELHTDDDDESLVIHPKMSSEYQVRSPKRLPPSAIHKPPLVCLSEAQKLTTFSSPQDWSALSENVQWAIIYDLANDHENGITAAANLLGLTLDDVIKFVNLYVREKALWENGTCQDEPIHTALALFQLDGAEHEVEQPVLEEEADQIMLDYEPDRQAVEARAIRTMTDAGVDPQIFEGVRDIWNEPEAELFYQTGTQVIAEKETGQLVPEKSTDKMAVQPEDEQSAPVTWPPAVELITDSFSREDIGSGRSFLEFVGLQDYADSFGQWFGRGTTFREIPGIFDDNNEFIFSTEDTEKALYGGNEFNWQAPVPRIEKRPAEREWLMEALPRNPAQGKGPADSSLQQFQALAQRVNGRPISLRHKNERFFNFVTEGPFVGLGYGEDVPAATLAEILADDESGDKEADNLTKKGPDDRAVSKVDRRDNNKARGTGENALQGTVGGFGDEGVQLFNMSSAMQLCPEMPRFDNGIAPRFLEKRHVDSDEGYGTRKSVPAPHAPPFPQLPPFLQPHGGMMYPASKAVPTPASLAQNSSHVVGSGHALPAQPRDCSSATPPPTTSQPIETSLRPDARTTAESDKYDTEATVAAASGEAINKAVSTDAQGTAESDQFTENGIEVATFPKCYSCFRVRARCDGGQPCSSCATRNRKCKPVTKAVLDEFPDRAERVIKDKAKADSISAHAEGLGTIRATASKPNTAVAAPAVLHTVTSGVKREHSAMTGGASADEDDSDLDNFPPEKEDPTDGDYGLAPKKKKQKKGNTPIGKKPTPSQAKAAVPATPSPTKKRGPYRKKGVASTPKPNERAVGATSKPTPHSGGSASAGNVVAATSARQTSAKAPAAVKDRVTGSTINAGGNSPSEAGPGRSVKEAAGVVRHAEGQFGMTNARPVPVGKRDETLGPTETRSILDPSLFSSNPSSGAQDSRYIDIPFAPVATRPHTSTGRFVPGMPIAQVSRSIAGLPDTVFRASPSRGAHVMPAAPSRLVPPRPLTVPAENDAFGNGEFTKPASSLGNPVALQEMLPVTSDRMPLATRIARAGLNGSPGAMEISPTSQSSNSGTTVSMDFSPIPFTPTQGPTAYRDVGVPGRQQSILDNYGMPGFSPNLSASMVPVDSPTASQQRRSASSYNHGAHGSGSSTPAPMMSPYPMFQQQRPIPRPISRTQQDPGYPVPQQTMHPSRTSAVFYDSQNEDMGPGSRGVSASPAQQQYNTVIPLPVKRQADAPLYPGQQPARKRPRVPASPLAPPREARSWKELARSQWATETQETQPETANFSVKPIFGGDGSFDASVGQSTRIQERIDPELQKTTMAAAGEMSRPSPDNSEEH